MLAKLALSVLVAAVALALGLSYALAQDSKIPSQVTIGESAPVAAGQVSSPSRFCERNRRVDVVLDVEGPGPNMVFGRARTDARGQWAIERMLADARFYAVARRKVAVRDGGRRICRQARSDAVRG